MRKGIWLAASGMDDCPPSSFYRMNVTIAAKSLVLSHRPAYTGIGLVGTRLSIGISRIAPNMKNRNQPINKTYYDYPVPFQLARWIFVLMAALFLFLVLASLGQRFIPGFPIVMQGPCDDSLSVCASSMLTLILCVPFLLLIRNAYSGITLEERGITVHFFPKSIFLPWEECTGFIHRKPGIFPYWFVSSKRLPLYCKVYGWIFSINRSGFLITGRIKDRKNLIYILKGRIG